MSMFVGPTVAMNTPATLYRRHRFPEEIIGHCVWFYFRFCFSYRDIEEMWKGYLDSARTQFLSKLDTCS